MAGVVRRVLLPVSFLPSRQGRELDLIAHLAAQRAAVGMRKGVMPKAASTNA